MKCRAFRDFHSCNLTGSSFYVSSGTYLEARISGNPDEHINKGTDSKELIVIQYNKMSCIVPYKIFRKYFKTFLK